jgi:Do/DeqQ family serine protease
MPEKAAASNKNICFLNRIFRICLVFSILAPAAGFAEKYNRETAVVKTVQRVGPAVVNISSEYEIRAQQNPFNAYGMDPFFERFFKDFFDHGYNRQEKRTSLGSGVIIDGRRGFILTNAHVITRAGTITVTLKDEREYSAQIVGADPDSDLAVLQIETRDALPDIQMSPSDDLLIGETVIAIGNPFGFSHTVTTGVISAVNRSVRTEARTFHDFIQIDAPINPGNSGGPLLNINGDLIGINTAIYADARGIGFAIPINKARRIVSDLIAYGEVIQAWIGLLVQDLNRELVAYYKIPTGKGVIVEAVTRGGPADRAGIKSGDIIMKIDNRPVPSNSAFQDIMRGVAADQTIRINLKRRDQILSVAVNARVFPPEQALALAERLLGVAVAELDPAARRQYRIAAEAGVLITQLRTGTYLDRIGAGPGDVIRRIDDVEIKNIADFKAAIVKFRRKKSVVLLLQRGHRGYYITVKL